MPVGFGKLPVLTMLYCNLSAILKSEHQRSVRFDGDQVNRVDPKPIGESVQWCVPFHEREHESANGIGLLEPVRPSLLQSLELRSRE